MGKAVRDRRVDDGDEVTPGSAGPPGAGILLDGIKIDDVLEEGVVGRGGGEGVGVQRVQRNHA